MRRRPETGSAVTPGLQVQVILAARHDRGGQPPQADARNLGLGQSRQHAAQAVRLPERLRRPQDHDARLQGQRWLLGQVFADRCRGLCLERLDQRRHKVHRKIRPQDQRHVIPAQQDRPRRHDATNRSIGHRPHRLLHRRPHRPGKCARQVAHLCRRQRLVSLHEQPAHAVAIGMDQRDAFHIFSGEGKHGRSRLALLRRAVRRFPVQREHLGPVVFLCRDRSRQKLVSQFPRALLQKPPLRQRRQIGEFLCDDAAPIVCPARHHRRHPAAAGCRPDQRRHERRTATDRPTDQRIRTRRLAGIRFVRPFADTIRECQTGGRA